MSSPWDFSCNVSLFLLFFPFSFSLSFYFFFFFCKCLWFWFWLFVLLTPWRGCRDHGHQMSQKFLILIQTHYPAGWCSECRIKKKNISKIFRFPNPVVGSMNHGQASAYCRDRHKVLLQNFYLIDPGISSVNLILQVTPGYLRAHKGVVPSAALLLFISSEASFERPLI